MFLDGHLRRLEAAQEDVTARLELSRRVMRIEVLSARLAARRVLVGATVGWAVARHVLAWLRGR